jgi:hypothetical protein
VILHKLRNTSCFKYTPLELERGCLIVALEEVLLPLLLWSSPIGLGVFFIGLGYLIKSTAGAFKKEKQNKEVKG